VAIDTRAQPEEVHELDGEPTLEGCFAPDGTDLTLIAWMLDLTPEQRLQSAQSMVDLVAAVRRRDED
jgi:hypothetical protein